MKKTESEILFETFCAQNGIRCESVPTMSKEKLRTPDYDIYPSGQLVVAEIKQIDPNPEELDQQKIYEKKGVATGDGTPGARVRGKIAAGASQIRIRAKGKHSSILVLYDNVRLSFHTDPYSIRVAMYGLEAHVLAVPEEMGRAPHLIYKRFGPKQKMTKDNNTSISAVAILAKGAEANPELVIFHNTYAEIPLLPEIFHPYRVKQFTLEEKVSIQFPDWTEV